MAIWKWIGGAALVVAAILLVMPQERWEHLNEAKLRYQEPGAMECLDKERPRLHDPESAKYVRTEFMYRNLDLGDEPIHVVKVHYRAKNGYGAMVQESAICALIKGHFDGEATQRARDAIKRKEVNDKLELQIKCLKERNLQMSLGRLSREATQATYDKYPACAKAMDWADN